jgi:hypothetical protein
MMRDDSLMDVHRALGLAGGTAAVLKMAKQPA